MLSRTDGTQGQATGQTVVNYAYTDPDGLLTQVQYPGAPGRTVTLGYDIYGRLATRTDATGTNTYTYGDLDETLSAVTQYTGLPAQTFGYTYYANGSRAALATPAGTFQYAYDIAGKPVSQTNPFGQTTSWTYLPNDWLQSQTLANGIKSSYAFTNRGELQSLENKRVSDNSVVSQFGTMLYDGAGNRLSITATVPGASALTGVTNYAYDIKDRLLSESSTKVSGYTAAFGYDPAGNLTQFKGQSRTYDQQNRLTGGQGLTGAYVYDERGNPTTYNGVSIAYTPENEATQFGTLLSADYGADRLRAWKQDAAGVRTYFLYDGVTPIHELDATGAVKATNTFGANGLTSRRDALGSDTFYTFDERGNVSERTNGTGQVLTRHIADAYGKTSAYDAGGTPLAQVPDPYSGFGGKHGYYTDVETGLILCTFRYYDPNTGRWLNQDPIGYDGGINIYSYCGGNPVNFVDPLGLQTAVLKQAAEKVVQLALPIDNIVLAEATGSSLVASGTTSLLFGGSQTTSSALLAAGKSSVPVAIITAGAFAALDLANYITTGKANGPFTKLGEAISGQLNLFPPTEAYDRLKHYGRTPNTAQKKHAGAGMVFDHDPALVAHYYEGNGQGGLPGYMMSDQERKSYGAAIGCGKSAPADSRFGQGGKAKAYGVAMRKAYFGY